MLRTPNTQTLHLEGINQQDYAELQRVQGVYPARTGLLQRPPGKTLQQQAAYPVGSIYAFYLVHGRHYQLIDFGTGIQIVETVVPAITLPGLPVSANEWIDTFFGYPDALLSRLWGAGIWQGNVGICETLIQGYIDPFLVYAEIPNLPIPQQNQPVPLPTPGSDPGVPNADPGSAPYKYPPGTADLVLHHTDAQSDNSCTGQGTQPVTADDIIRLRNYSGGPQVDSIDASAITIGGITLWHGLKLGRDANTDIGLVVGTCPGPPFPEALEYSLYVNTGQFSQDS